MTVVWRCGRFLLNLEKQPLFMGVLNVTPDSFSDGYPNPDQALNQAARLVADGAHMIDVGGESTRPGSESVALQQELDRVLPVIEAIGKRFEIPISVDTQKVVVARAAVSAGASIINHVSSSLDYQEMLELLSETRVGYVAMHMRSRPKSMQKKIAYRHVVNEVSQSLQQIADLFPKAGVGSERLLFDPGIGFGKSLDHNLEILNSLNHLARQLGRPLLMGLSRKSWLNHLFGADLIDIGERDAYTMVASSLLPFPAVAIHRVHNIRWLKNSLRLKSLLSGSDSTVD